MPDATNVLEQLMAVIVDRREKMPADSWTTKLFTGGTAKIGAKITEEAGEVVEAAAALEIAPAGADQPSQRAHLIHEAADLLYHLLVLLAHHHLTLDDVHHELAGRFGISGIAEKASRPPKSH